MKSFEVLRAAHKLIQETGWAQTGALAVDASGQLVPVVVDRKPNPAAARYTIYSAIVRVGLDGGATPQRETTLMWEVLVREAVKRRTERDNTSVHPVLSFNDRYGQSVDGVLEFLLDCAELCELESGSLPTEPMDPAAAGVVVS